MVIVFSSDVSISNISSSTNTVNVAIVILSIIDEISESHNRKKKG